MRRVQHNDSLHDNMINKMRSDTEPLLNWRMILCTSVGNKQVYLTKTN